MELITKHFIVPNPTDFSISNIEEFKNRLGKKLKKKTFDITLTDIFVSEKGNIYFDGFYNINQCQQGDEIHINKLLLNEHTLSNLGLLATSSTQNEFLLLIDTIHKNIGENYK